MYKYDEKANVAVLESVAPGLRPAFAAACAQRVLPCYRAYAKAVGLGTFEAVAAHLDYAWDCLLSGHLDPEQSAARSEACMALIPGEEGTAWASLWAPQRPYAEDAVAALTYALRSMARCDPQEAAWAGRRAYEALDYMVINVLGIRDEAAILAHPAVQAELARQQRDLSDLAGGQTAAGDVVAALLRRSHDEASEFFGAVMPYVMEP